MQAVMLARMAGPELPSANGVLYHDPAASFTDMRHDSDRQALRRGALTAFMTRGKTWVKQ